MRVSCEAPTTYATTVLGGTRVRTTVVALPIDMVTTGEGDSIDFAIIARLSSTLIATGIAAIMHNHNTHEAARATTTTTMDRAADALELDAVSGQA